MTLPQTQAAASAEDHAWVGYAGDMAAHLYVAGSAQGTVAGWGYCLVEDDRIVAETGRAEAGASAYRMELAGLVEGLRAIASGSVEVHLANDNIVRTGREWLHTWRARGWRKKGGSIQHLDLVQALATQLDRLEVRWAELDKRDASFIRAKAWAQDAAVAVPEPDPAQAGARAGSGRVEPSAARLVAYTDGGCRGNPGIGGWGFLLIDVPSGRALEVRGGAAETTNNRMEVQAAIEALSAIHGEGQSIEIRTDSNYLREMAESWLPGWKRRGWRRSSGDPVKNLELVKQLDVLLQRHRVSWRRVAGHSGEPGNEHADALANAAMDALAAGGDGAARRRYEASPVEVSTADGTDPA